MIQFAGGQPSPRGPRPYLSFPRGTKVPSPRVLLYASDLSELALRDVALAAYLSQELPGSSLVVATGSDVATRFAPRAALDVVKLPGLGGETPRRPLEIERIRRLRQKLLRTLFDVFIPDLVVLDMVGPEAEAEARLLLTRARVLGSGTLVGVSHDLPGEACRPADGSLVCTNCRANALREARLALSTRDERRRPRG